MKELQKLIEENRDFRSDYLSNVLSYDKIPTTINEIIYRLKKEIKNGLEFNSIACCGISGSILAGAIAAKLGVDVVVVRKPNDSNGQIGGSHSSWRVEGRYGNVQYIIIDDFIDSGGTIRYIIDEIKRENNKFKNNSISCCKGVVLYNPSYKKSRESVFFYEKKEIRVFNII